MSELIQSYDAEGGRLVKTLARALEKTGPVLHGGYCWSGRVKDHRHTLKKEIKLPRGAKDAAKVEVPWGMLPELLVGDLDRPLATILIERFKGYVEAIESGAAVPEKAEDAGELADSLETLADDLRLLSRSEALREKVERLKELYGRQPKARDAGDRGPDGPG